MSLPQRSYCVLSRLARVQRMRTPRRPFQLPGVQCKHSSSHPTSVGTEYNAWRRSSSAVLAAAATAGLVYIALNIQEAHAEIAADTPEFRIEKTKKKKGLSKEENRDLISSQHLQVKKSWENPGVYAWGSNTGKVAAPDSDDVYVKTPRRIPYFDNLLLRDLKLDRNFGVAINENGDLIQWGKGYSEEHTQPTMTLRGKNLESLAISRDRVIALSRSGEVYSVPVSKTDQENGPKPSESSWIPWRSEQSAISYRKLQPQNLGRYEKVTAISGGLEHALLLTNSGRVFSVASGTEDFPARGQLGVPGVTWQTRPEGPYDMCHELTTLKGFDIADIAAGDHHSLVLDKEGRIFSFGDNSSGQLGIEYNPEAPYVDAPVLLPIQKLYSGTSLTPKVTSISAGGVNSFFTVDAKRLTRPGEDLGTIGDIERITVDTWSCGQGIKGGLGTGKWTHIQGTPKRIPSLSGLSEYDEKNNQVVPIRLAQMSVGSTHASAVMDNVTYLGASEQSSENDTNWGADVVWWGGNEFYQLGSGKRNNVATPIYIQPLDTKAEIEAGRKEEHRFHITPRHTVTLNGRKVSFEQRVECGRNVTAVYSGV